MASDGQTEAMPRIRRAGFLAPGEAVEDALAIRQARSRALDREPDDSNRLSESDADARHRRCVLRSWNGPG
jgi:hypothetical protein